MFDTCYGCVGKDGQRVIRVAQHLALQVNLCLNFQPDTIRFKPSIYISITTIYLCHLRPTDDLNDSIAYLFVERQAKLGKIYNKS